MSSKGSIFISYRRSDSQDVTRELYDKIAHRFPGGMVFRDLDTIGGGFPWKGFIEAQLANCRVFIAVIGPTWLNVTWDGQRRLDIPNDWVRREIEYAFINGIPIIPVLVNGTSTPKEAELPGPWLKRLPMLQARRIRYESAIDQNHIDSLIQDINKQLKKPDPRKVYQENIEGCVLEMIRIPKGIFWMGSGKGDSKAWNTEKPHHKVNMPEFSMGKYPVTQQQWYVVSLLPDIDIPLNPHPSKFEGEYLPVNQVNWHEAVEFCKRLTQYSFQKKEKYPNMKYRLPSEAEWEYACKAGTTTTYAFGNTLTPNQSNFRRYNQGGNKGFLDFFGKEILNGNFLDRFLDMMLAGTSPVSSYPANNFGLHDMHGNVWEWCLDHWHDSYQGAPIDGSAWIESCDLSLQRVLRGGSWRESPSHCRSASRINASPGLSYECFGFRVVCLPQGF